MAASGGVAANTREIAAAIAGRFCKGEAALLNGCSSERGGRGRAPSSRQGRARLRKGPHLFPRQGEFSFATCRTQDCCDVTRWRASFAAMKCVGDPEEASIVEVIN